MIVYMSLQKNETRRQTGDMASIGEYFSQAIIRFIFLSLPSLYYPITNNSHYCHPYDKTRTKSLDPDGSCPPLLLNSIILKFSF